MTSPSNLNQSGNKYPISDGSTLRDVYLMWLIANDPREFASEHGLSTDQLIAFRDCPQFTWLEFKQERQAV